MTKIVEIVGGPRDGQQYSIDGNVLVLPEISSSIHDWITQPDPTVTPMPTFKQVHYKVIKRYGKWCAVHPGIVKSA